MEVPCLAPCLTGFPPGEGGNMVVVIREQPLTILTSLDKRPVDQRSLVALVGFDWAGTIRLSEVSWDASSEFPGFVRVLLAWQTRGGWGRHLLSKPAFRKQQKGDATLDSCNVL